MVELLVVMAIIATLAALSIQVMAGVTDQANRAATKATILKVNELLEQRVEAYRRAVEQNALDKAEELVAEFIQELLPQYRGRKNRPPASRIIATKELFRTNFPQRFSEMLDADADGVPNEFDEDADGDGDRFDIDPDEKGTFGKQNFVPTAHVSETESSELLYYLLTRMDVFGIAAVDSDAFKASEVQDTDGDGLLEFVDSWGQPLRFYRWPTRLIRPLPLDTSDTQVIRRDIAETMIKGMPGPPPEDPSSPGTLLSYDQLGQDPDDPLGRIEILRDHPRNGTVWRRIFKEYEDESINLGGGAVANLFAFHTTDTWHTPLIVSAGADGEFGLYAPNQTGDLEDGTSDPGDGILDRGHLAQPLPSVMQGNFDPLWDNISNRNTRAGARR